MAAYTVRRTLLAPLLLGGLVLLMQGCTPYEFVLVRPVTDATFEQKVVESSMPSIVLVHQGPSSGGAWRWGPVLERFARVHPTKVNFVHYDTSKGRAWLEKLGIRMNGTPYLFVGGQKKGSIGTYMPSEEGRIAQVFLLADRYLLGSDKVGHGRAAKALDEKYFDYTVLSSRKPVILAFDRLRKGG